MHFAIIINSTIWPNCFYPIMEDYFDECMQTCKIITNIKQMSFWECIDVKGLGNLIAKFNCKLEKKKTLFVNFQGVFLGNPKRRKSTTLGPPQKLSKVVKTDVMCHFYISFHISIMMDALVCQVNHDNNQTLS